MIPTDSMRPTLVAGDRVFVTKTPGALRRGDIAWFRPPAGPNTRGVFVKRIVGTPGDRIRIAADAVYRNGQRLAEPYALYNPNRHNPSAENTETVVPPNAYYVLGDNRENSMERQDRVRGRGAQNPLEPYAALRAIEPKDPYPGVGRTVHAFEH